MLRHLSTTVHKLSLLILLPLLGSTIEANVWPRVYLTKRGFMNIENSLIVAELIVSLITKIIILLYWLNKL